MAGSVGKPLEPGPPPAFSPARRSRPGADAVVIQEETAAVDDFVLVKKKPKPGDWVRYVGSDIRKNSEILPAGKRLLPQDTASPPPSESRRCRSSGRCAWASFSPATSSSCRASRSRRAHLQLQPLHAARPGAAFGCEVRDYGIVPDSLEATREVLRRAAQECDLIVTSGGVSVGDADYVKPAVEAEGRLLMWRIAMKPGRPLAFGRIANAAFIGLPGNPVSSFVTFLIFVRPFLLRTQGLRQVEPKAIAARADFDWTEPDSRREFLRAKWNAQGGLDLYPTQDSAVLTSTAWADGLIDNPAGHAIRKGDAVRFLPYSELLG
jgi:molybdopterin molybdotransferase